MKTKLFTLLLMLYTSIWTLSAWNYEHVQIGDLYYNLDVENNTAEVTSQIEEYPYWSTIITVADIPTSLEYNSVTYGVISIGEHAFHDCTSLTSVTIPNSVVSIGWYAFEGCTGLTSIEIPNNITSIGMAAFAYCVGLTSIEIPNSVLSIEASTFSSCTGLTSVIIPNSVTYIRNNAFKDCTGLTSIEIPNSVLGIEASSFSGCTSLTSVIIPNSVTSIGNYAFMDCTSLSSVKIGNSVINIGYRAFNNCKNMISVTCEAVNPPSLSEYVFNKVDKSIPLYVPSESIFAYQTADQWKDFKNIQAIPVQESLPTIYHNFTNTSQKLIRNGNVYILRGDRTYTLTGQEVK